MQWSIGRGDVLLLYADTIFRPSVLTEIIQSKFLVTVGIDTDWKERLLNSQHLSNAEKVTLEDECIISVGRSSITPIEADAQFSGLTLLKKDVVEKLNQTIFGPHNHEQKISDKDSLTDLLGFIAEELEY